MRIAVMMWKSLEPSTRITSPRYFLMSSRKNINWRKTPEGMPPQFLGRILLLAKGRSSRTPINRLNNDNSASLKFGDAEKSLSFFMRKLLILIALMAVAPLARAQEGSYTIKSDVQGIDGDSYYLTIWNGTSQTVSKQADLVDGQIDYKDTTSVPLVIRITVANKELYKMAGRGSFPAKSQSIWLVATPGDNIILKGQFSDFSEVYPE